MFKYVFLFTVILKGESKKECLTQTCYISYMHLLQLQLTYAVCIMTHNCMYGTNEKWLWEHCVCVCRLQSICVSCACRTWCGATARRSALSGNTRWILSRHQNKTHCLYPDCQVSCLLLLLFITLLINPVWTDGAEDDRQWALQGQEGQLPTERAQTVRQHEAQ